MSLFVGPRYLCLFIAALCTLSAARGDLEALLSSQINPAVATPSWKIPVLDVPINKTAFTANQLQDMVPPNPKAAPEVCNSSESDKRSIGTIPRLYGHMIPRLYGHRLLQSVEERKPFNRRLLGPPALTVDYNGGPILKTANVYMIYVQADTASDWSWTALPNYFVSNLQNSSRWQVLKNLYMNDGNGNKISYSGNITLAGTAQITLPAGTMIRNGQSCGQGPNNTVDNFLNLVANVIIKEVLPWDDNGLYLISPNLDTGLVASYGLCNFFNGTDRGDCGWHSELIWNYSDGTNTSMAYGYVPYATTCGCGLDDPSFFSEDAQLPSGSIWLDGFVDTLLHELEEAVADPQPGSHPGWNTRNDPHHQGEVADVCTADFKPVFNTTVQGRQVVYNAVVGGVPFAVHNGYDAATKMCVAALQAQ